MLEGTETRPTIPEPPRVERSDLAMVGPSDPRDAVVPVSLDDRLAVLTAQAGITTDKFGVLPVDLETGALAGSVPHSKPGTVLLLVTHGDTAYLCMEPDAQGFRDVTRRGQTPFARVPVAGRAGMNIEDGKPFRARIVNGCATVDGATGQATIDEAKMATAQVPVLKPLELEMSDVPGRIVRTAHMVDGERSRYCERATTA